MANRIDFEKVGVYIAVMVGFLTTIFYIFEIKDDLSEDRQKIARLEVKVEKLEEK